MVRDVASFRGAGFFLSTDSTAVGRRMVKHEYALKDIPFMEDMGRKAREFTIEGFVVGPTYEQDRDALLTACETQGTGTLVHPIRGVLTVACTGMSLRQTVEEGGIARFSLTFIEAGAQQFPTSVTDPNSTLNAAADLLNTLTAADTVVRLVTQDVPEFVREASSGEVGKLVGLLGDMVFPGVAGEDMAQFNRLVKDLGDDRGTLASSPADLTTRVQAAVTAISDTAATPEQANTNLQALLGFMPDSEPTTTPYRRSAGGNRQAVADLITRTAAAESARAVLGTTFESYEDAVAARDSLADVLDIESETASDAVYPALVDLRVQLVNAVPADSESLPHLVQLTLSQATPALALAYDLYEDASRDAEMVARNHIRNPCFVPAGEPLAVLTDA